MSKKLGFVLLFGALSFGGFSNIPPAASRELKQNHAGGSSAIIPARCRALTLARFNLEWLTDGKDTKKK
jgi:hypothetical protein